MNNVKYLNRFPNFILLKMANKVPNRCVATDLFDLALSLLYLVLTKRGDICIKRFFDDSRREFVSSKVPRVRTWRNW